MNLADLLVNIFGETEVILFDQASDKDVTVIDFDTADAAIAGMKTPCVDLIATDGMLYGVVVEGDYSAATFALTRTNDTLSVFVLENPMDPEDIEEDALTSFPVSWTVEGRTNQFYSMGDIDAATSGNGDPTEGDADEAAVSDEDVDTPPLVETPDEDDPETGSEAIGEDDEHRDDGSAPAEGPVMVNDAELLGVRHPEMDELFAKPVICMTGELWDQGDRRNTPAGKWKRNEMQWGALLGAEWSPLTKHVESGNKQGASIVLGETIDGNRNAESVKSLYAVVIDIDSGPKVDDVIEKLQKLGYFALIYTSYNHNKTKVVLKHDEVMRKLKIKETPNRVQIIEYLRLHHKDRYDEEFLEGIEVVDARKHGPKGLQIVLKTPPLHKFRIVLPLWEPVELAELGTTASEWKDAWADIVTGFVVNELGVSFDATSCDVNRLFYTPRHPKGDDNWDIVLTCGKVLRVEDIKPHSKNEYVKNRDNDPFAYGLGKDDDRPAQCVAPSGMVLNAWHTKAKERFLITDVILEHAPDKVRREVSDGKLEIECPFEHEHSTEGGTGTVVMSPEVNENGYWTISCPHDACQGRHKLEFLEEMLKAEWFDEDCLTDPEYLLGAEDEEEPAPAEPVNEKGEHSLISNARELGDDLNQAEVLDYINKAIKRGADDTQRNKIIDILAGKTSLTVGELKKMWRGAQKTARDAEMKEAAKSEDLSDFKGAPDVKTWDEQDLAQYGARRIQDQNEKHPFLFKYLDNMARIQQNADGKPQIKMLNQDRFGSELNKVARYEEVTYRDDKEVRRGVFAPVNVVKHLFNGDELPLLALHGLVTTPMFVGEGDLIIKGGFHHGSGLYYEPDLSLDIPRVNAEPTEEEVRASREALLDIIADFPLGGLTREEIEAQAFTEKGVAAVAHCFSLILMLYCRDLIKGPTPGHLFTKPAPGTGASLLVDTLSTLTYGGPSPASAIPRNDDEMSKTLITFMADGLPMIYFDNINQNVDSGVLASAMTAPTFRARMLGSNQTVETQVRCAFVFTGNNVVLSPELLRRLVMIDLDAQMAAPETRTDFKHQDIIQHVKDNRAELVHACLTLIQNWIAKGKPEFSGIPLNSYENWARTMGGILEAAGVNGFLENRALLKEIASDDADDEILPLLDAWWEKHGDTKAVVKLNSDIPSLMALALDDDIQLPIRMKVTVDGDRTLDGKAFGRMLAGYRGRVFVLTSGEEVILERIPTRHKHGTLWRLRETHRDGEDDE